MMLDECALHRMQLVAVGKAFDRADALALRLDREHQAGPDRLVVEDHGACTAHAVLATDVRSGQPALVADHVDQRLSRLHLNGVVTAVDVELDIDLLDHHWFFAPAPAECLSDTCILWQVKPRETH